jgi:hypothetical protein
MKYLMIVRVDGELAGRMTPTEGAAMGKGGMDWASQMDARGKRVTGHHLGSSAEGKVVRRREGRTSITDGPYAEAKEQIAGFDILECNSMEEAVETASKHPVATIGALEIRAFGT